MRYVVIVALWLLPCALFCGHPEDSARADALVRQTLKALAPPGATAFDFRQSVRRLGHMSRPWQTFNRDAAGSFLLERDGTSFYRSDSARIGRDVGASFALFSDTSFALIRYGSEKPAAATPRDRQRYLYEVSALTPVFLLRDFLRRQHEGALPRRVGGAVDSIIYTGSDGAIISLAIDPDSALIRSAKIVLGDDLYGDVTKLVTFDHYASAADGGLRYPSRIVVNELGFDASIATITQSARRFDAGPIVERIPPGYHLLDDPPEPPVEVVRHDYNPRIHLLELSHADARVLVVEFNEYLLVAEAPLNSKNGELIIAKAREIAPAKPIRYFVFGHHHPHYIGGIRAFIHNGATVLCTPGDSAYVRQLASFTRSLAPDSLAIEPRPLRLEMVEGETNISDGEMEMRIIHIGEMSHHTDDYLIYYFPQYRLLYQGDLAAITEDGAVKKATEPQRGLYDAIVRYGLDVATIVQSWPLRGYGVKTIFEFDELRRSVELMQQGETPK